MKANPEGNKQAQADYLTGQKAGKQSPGLKSTGKADVNKGLNAANAERSLSDFGQTLKEGDRISKENLMDLLEARAVKPKEEVVNKNTKQYKILKTFATILPEIQARVAKSFNEQFPDEPNISPVKLGKVLQISLNALAEIPETKMRQFIMDSGGDIALYNMVLNKVNEAGETQQNAIKSGVNYKIMIALSAVVPEFKTKITKLYNANSNDTLPANRVVGFLQVVLNAAAMIPSNRLALYIANSGGDPSIYKTLLSRLKDLEKGEEGGGQGEGLNFDVKSFMPDTVGDYDLKATKRSFRIALSEKAAEIISRHPDMKIDEKNMLNVMTQLIDLINNKYLDKANPKRIPKVGE